MDIKETLSQFMNNPDSFYEYAINDMARAILGMSLFHHKPLEQIGLDLNKAVKRLKEKDND